MGTIESSTYYSQTSTVDTSSTIPNNRSSSQSSSNGVESSTIRIHDNNHIVDDTNNKKNELQSKNSTSTNNDDDDITRLSSRKNIRTLKGVVYGDSNVGKSLLIRRLRGESVFPDCCFDSDNDMNNHGDGTIANKPTNHEKAKISSNKRKFMALIPWKYHQQSHFTSQQRQLLLLDSNSNDHISIMTNTDDIIQLHITESSSSSTNPPTPNSLWNNYSSLNNNYNFNNPDFMIFLIDPRRRNTLDYVMTCLENMVRESSSEGTWNEQPTQRDEIGFTPTLSICIFLNFFDILRVQQHMNDSSQQYSSATSTTNTTANNNNNIPHNNISETKISDYVTFAEIQSRIKSFQSQLPNHRLDNVNKTNHDDTQSNTPKTKYNTLRPSIPKLQFQVFDSSMKNGYGLQQLNTFMVLPYLQSKRKDMYRYMMRLQMGYDRWSTALLQNIHHNENSETRDTCCEVKDGTSSSTTKNQNEKDSKPTTHVDSIPKDTIILPPIMTYEELDRLHHLQLSISNRKQRSLLVNQKDRPQSADSQNDCNKESTLNNDVKLKSSSTQHEQTKSNDNRRTIFSNDLKSNTKDLDKNVQSIKSRHKEESDNTNNSDKETTATTTATQKRKHKHSKTKINKKDIKESIVADNLTSQNQDKNDITTKHYHNDQQQRSKKGVKMEKDITKKMKHMGNDSNYNKNASSLPSLMNLEAFLGSDDDDNYDTAKKNKHITNNKYLKLKKAQPKFQYKNSTRNANVMYSDDESVNDSDSDSVSDSSSYSQKNVSNTTNVNNSSRQIPSNKTVIQKSSSTASTLSQKESEKHYPKDETVTIQKQTFNPSDDRELQNIHHGDNGDEKDVDNANDDSDDNDDEDEGNTCKSSLGAVVGIVDDKNKIKTTKPTSNMNASDDEKNVDDSIDDSCSNDGNNESDCTRPSIAEDREDINSMLSSASEQNSTNNDAGNGSKVDHGSSKHHCLELADHDIQGSLSSISKENDVIQSDDDDINDVDHRNNTTEPSLITNNHGNAESTSLSSPEVKENNYQGSTSGKNCKEIDDNAYENKSTDHYDEVDKTIVSPTIVPTRFDDDDSDSDNDDYIISSTEKMHKPLVNDKEDEDDDDDEVDKSIVSPITGPITRFDDDGSDSDNDDYIIPTNEKMHKSIVNDAGEDDDDDDECFIIKSTKSDITTQRTMTTTTTSTSNVDMHQDEDDTDDITESLKTIVMTRKEETKNESNVDSNTSSKISNQVLASIAAAQKEAELMLQNAMQNSKPKRVKMKEDGVANINQYDSDEVGDYYDKGKDSETRRNKKKKKEKKSSSSSSKKSSSKSKRRDVEIIEGDYDKDGLRSEKETKKKQGKKKEKKGDSLEYK